MTASGGENAKVAPSWRVTGSSVRGAYHERRNLPNQDAVRWQPLDGEGLPLVLAVSDGHGSTKHLRSEVGARLAVEVATDILWSIVSGEHSISEQSSFSRARAAV